MLTRNAMFHDPNYPAIVSLDANQRALIRETNDKIANGTIGFEEMPCLCGAEDFDLIALYDRYRIAQPTVICRRCGLIQSRPRMAPATLTWFYGSDFYRTVYCGDRDFNQNDDQFQSAAARADVWRAAIEAKLGDRVRSVAEIGCGGGWNLYGYHLAGRRVVGCDPSQEATALGRRMGMDIRTGWMDVLKGERVDLLILSHVVEHFSDPVAEVRRAVELVNPRWTYIEVPNAEEFCLVMLQNAHLYYFTPPTLRHFMGMGGLKPIVPIPRGTHFGYLFEVGAAPDEVDLAGEYDRICGIIQRFERRESVKELLRRLGMFQKTRAVMQWLRRHRKAA